MKIFSVAVNLHDHNTYDGVFHNQRERYTRSKKNMVHIDGKMIMDDYTLNEEFLNEYFVRKEGHILAFSYSRGGIKNAKDRLFSTILKGHDDILSYTPTKLFDYYYKDDIYYVDHHQSHSAYAFLSSGYAESDILAIDGIGSKFKCIFFGRDQKLIDLSSDLPIGMLWNTVSRILGFGHLDVGKVMGLAGYGKYNDYYYNALQILLEENLVENYKKIYDMIDVGKNGKEDLAYTIQKFTIDKIAEYILPLKTSENLCVAGGVSYNGYMNEYFTKHYKNVFVPPAPGDEGQSIGVYMHADYVLNGNVHIPELYAGIEHPVDETLFTERLDMDTIAKDIANGKIVGWYQGKSESGNRALGNRSILADPRNPHIKDIINKHIKMREDFRPFAPSVLEEHYREYFDTNQPSPYMSRIMPVISDKIPGVTHVDGTARIQTVTRELNERYYDLICAFYHTTGIPMLLNTSFNCQEPIVETPEDAIATFRKTGLDILVVNDWVMRK